MFPSMSLMHFSAMLGHRPGAGVDIDTGLLWKGSARFDLFTMGSLDADEPVTDFLSRMFPTARPQACPGPPPECFFSLRLLLLFYYNTSSLRGAISSQPLAIFQRHRRPALSWLPRASLPAVSPRAILSSVPPFPHFLCWPIPLLFLLRSGRERVRDHDPRARRALGGVPPLRREGSPFQGRRSGPEIVRGLRFAVSRSELCRVRPARSAPLSKVSRKAAAVLVECGHGLVDGGRRRFVRVGLFVVRGAKSVLAVAHVSFVPSVFGCVGWVLKP